MNRLTSYFVQFREAEYEPLLMKKRMQSNRLRWWPALVILALDLLVLAWVWWFADVIRQNRVITTLFAQIAAASLLLLWFMFFSRARWRDRWLLLAAVALSIFLLITFVEIDGVSGDLMPRFRLRYAATEKVREGVSHLRPAPPPVIPAAGEYRNYPQFLGPNRDGILNDLELDRNWAENPPVEVWRRPVGAAWSSFAVANMLALTQEQNGENEEVACYDLRDGRQVWRHSDLARYSTGLGGTGPRATPTVVDGRVYALGATGILNCLDLATGKRYWHKDILQDNDARLAQWGMSGSPLLLDSLVVVCPGGPADRSLVAYARDSGALVWSAGSDKAGYSSPMLATIAGQPQILIFNDANVVSHAPQTGQILWKFPWVEGTQKVAQPIVLDGDRVLVLSGYGVGSKMLQIQRTPDGSLTPRVLWESRRLKPKFANVVVSQEFIYGLDDGILTCVEADTGKRRWKGGRYGHGQLILVNDTLLITTEGGQIVLVEATATEFNELAAVPALSGKTWNNPALAGQYLLARNSEEAVCLRLPVAAKNLGAVN